MVESSGLERRLGGNVEPLDRGFVKARPSPKPEPAAERFELHDPRSDLTYRVKTFFKMVAKANQLGATRFTAIDPDGTRSTVSKTGGTWRRDDLPPRDREERQSKATTQTTLSPAPSVQAEPETKSDSVAKTARIEIALNERYVITRAPIRIGDLMVGQTEYRHRGDTSRIAFTESTFRLSTDTNSPSVARSMVDVAEARGWNALRVSGNEDFRRLVWLESSLRGVPTIGYEPVPGDQEMLRKESESRRVNRIEPMASLASSTGAAAPNKQSVRGSGARKAVLAALDAVLAAKNVPERQREAIMAAAEKNLTARIAKGETHRVKIYDKTVPPQRAPVTPARGVQREHERSAPAR